MVQIHQPKHNKIMVLQQPTRIGAQNINYHNIPSIIRVFAINLMKEKVLNPVFEVSPAQIVGQIHFPKHFKIAGITETKCKVE